MPCYHPIEVGVYRKSLYTSRGIRDLVTVPCGSCVGCRAEQGRQWAVRMMHESRMHESNVFVTLTIEDGKLNENRELCAKDFSGFIKSLRKTQQKKLSFFGCGEYGERTGRPHYHAMLFNCEFLDRDIGFDSSRPDVWRSQALDDTWGRGICEGGTVTMASASYVAGYIRKKVKAKDRSRANPNTGVLLEGEFSRMSLRPAIGLKWISKWWADVYPRDFVVIDGVEAKPPRYYDRYMDWPDEKGGSKERRELMELVRQKRVQEVNDLTKYQLASGEKIHQARVNLFARRDRI